MGRYLQSRRTHSKLWATRPFLYTMNNPLRFIDPTGMAEDDVVRNGDRDESEIVDYTNPINTRNSGTAPTKSQLANQAAALFVVSVGVAIQESPTIAVAVAHETKGPLAAGAATAALVGAEPVAAVLGGLSLGASAIDVAANPSIENTVDLAASVAGLKSAKIAVSLGSRVVRSGITISTRSVSPRAAGLVSGGLAIAASVAVSVTNVKSTTATIGHLSFDQVMNRASPKQR